jgi:hypothetical protein
MKKLTKVVVWKMHRGNYYVYAYYENEIPNLVRWIPDIDPEEPSSHPTMKIVSSFLKEVVDNHPVIEINDSNILDMLTSGDRVIRYLGKEYASRNKV